MTRCEEFYEKWKEDPNWCEKTPGAVSQINSYLGLVAIFEDMGIPKNFTFVNLPEFTARPLVSIKDPTVKDKVIDKVASSLKAKKKYKETMIKGDIDPGKITSDDVKSIISEVTEPEKQHPTDVEEETYYVRFKIKDKFGEDMSAWVKITYDDYEALVTKYGTV